MQRGTRVIFEAALISETCCNCGMLFAMTEDFRRQRRADGKSFFCPAGHSQHYTGASPETLMRQERDRARQELARAEEEAAAAKAEATALRKAAATTARRTKAGLCPCCNRSFVALARHMATKHPTFAKPPVQH